MSEPSQESSQAGAKPPSAKREPTGIRDVGDPAGLAAVVAVTVVAVIKYDTAADVVTVLGAVTGVIAALVGAYFGVRGATLAQQKANEAGATTLTGSQTRAGGAGWPRRHGGEKSAYSGVIPGSSHIPKLTLRR